MKTKKLPDGWKEVELGNEDYFTILSSGINKFVGKKGYLSTESIKRTRINKIECSITYTDRPSRANMQPLLNSIWFAKMQSTLKVYSFNEENKDELNKYILSTGFAGIKVNEKLVFLKYLRLLLISNDFNELKDKLCTGSTQKGINNQFIKKISLVIPPFQTQKAIVKILEKAEKTKEWRKEADELTKNYLKSVFLEIFEGYIRKNQGRIKLGEILKEIDSGLSPVCESYSRNNENQKAVLKLGAVTYGFFNPSKNKCLIPKTKISREVNIQKEDLLFTRKNTLELVGATAYCFEDHKNLLLPDTIFKLIYRKDKVNGIFLWKLLSDKNVRKNLQRLATGSAGSMPNISKTRLIDFEIPLPPMELQNRFASIVREVEAMKEYQKQSEQQIDSLFNSLIQKAFKGELVA